MLIIPVLIVLIIWMVWRQKKDSPAAFSNIFLLQKAYRLKILSAEQIQTIFQTEETELIEKWLKKKLITPEQAHLLRYGNQLPQKTKEKTVQPKTIKVPPSSPKEMRHLIWGISAFAGGCVVLGIIALIAANWDIIPPTIKLISYFILMGSSIFVLCFARQKHILLLNDLFLGICTGLTGAGIGLIGQIYHLSGSFWNAFFLWIILTTPYFLISRFKEAPLLWSILYGVGVVLSTASNSAVLWLLLILPLVMRYKQKKAMSIVWWISFVVACLKAEWFNDILNWLEIHVMPVPALFFIGCILTLGWLICQRFLTQEAAFSIIFKKVVMIFFISSIILIDFIYTSSTVQFSPEKGYLSICFALSGVALPLLWLYQHNREKHQEMFFFLYIGLVVSFIYSFVSFSFAGLLMTVFSLMGLGIYAVKQKDMSLFNLCLILMFLRVLWAYIDLFMSLMSTGLSLIILGLVIWMGLWFWIKGRQTLAAFIQRRLTHE